METLSKLLSLRVVHISNFKNTQVWICQLCATHSYPNWWDHTFWERISIIFNGQSLLSSMSFPTFDTHLMCLLRNILRCLHRPLTSSISFVVGNNMHCVLGRADAMLALKNNRNNRNSSCCSQHFKGHGLCTLYCSLHTENSQESTY